MKVLLLIALVVLADRSTGKVFTRCSLAKELKRLGVAVSDIPYYVCIAKRESKYNTNAGADGHEKFYGLFQISGYDWCSPSSNSYSQNFCKVNCNNLLTNDISESIKCAQLIKKKQGWQAWSGYKACKSPVEVQDCF